MLRLLLTSVNMFVSVIIAAVVFGLMAVYTSDFLYVLIDNGKVIEDWIFHQNFFDSKASIIMDVLITGHQMVFLSLVILARILIGLIMMPFSRSDY